MKPEKDPNRKHNHVHRFSSGPLGRPQGSLDLNWGLIAGIAFVATVLESLPLRSAYDEFTVPFATALLMWLAHGGPSLSPVW